MNYENLANIVRNAINKPTFEHSHGRTHKHHAPGPRSQGRGSRSAQDRARQRKGGGLMP